MAVTSGFYNSVNHDRKYNAMQLANLLDGIINDGVFMTVGDHFAVSQNSGMTVKVGIGRAWFNMTWLYNDSQLVLAVEPSDLTLPRIDAVVVEVNTSQEVRASTIKIVKGTPNASPVAPTMVSTATIHQYPLALISVGANVSSITADKITNKVGTADCPYVNGILTTSTVEAQAASWETAFNTWFDGVKGTLSGDVAGNLLNLINDRVKYTDRASESEALDGTDDVKYMTPAKNKRVLNRTLATVPWIKIASYETAGAGNWVAPDLFGNGQPYEVGVMIIGGGGSGHARVFTVANSNHGSLGGASGYSLYIILTVTPGQSFPYVVGAKGAAVTASKPSTPNADGLSGGSSAFNGKTAAGGGGGKPGIPSYGKDSARGAQCAPCYEGYNSVPEVANPFGGTVVTVQTDSSNHPYVGGIPSMCFNPFENRRILGAGGGALGGTQYNGGKDPITGLGGGNSMLSTGTNTASSANAPGCGGGGCFVYTDAATASATSGAGADGAVYIYARKAVS